MPKALAVARQQSAKLAELAAATALAQLWQHWASGEQGLSCSTRGDHNFGFEGDQLLGHNPDSIEVAGTPTQIDLHIATVVPVQL